MTALYIILGILLLLFLLSLLRIGIRAELGEETRLTVIAGPARIQVLPKAEKPEREKKPKKKNNSYLMLFMRTTKTGMQTKSR